MYGFPQVVSLAFMVSPMMLNAFVIWFLAIAS